MKRMLMLTLVAMLNWTGATAQAAKPAKAEKLGQVRFPISCTAAAQTEFNRALAYYHSFWFDPALNAFQAVSQRDPKCGMAQWGIALASLGNPFTWPPNPKALAAATTASTEAQRLGAQSERERDFIAAVAALLPAQADADFRGRVSAWENAMAIVAQRYPQDVEVQIFYALALNVAAQPTDKTYAKQIKAAEILEPLFKRLPQHPGVAHYLIHTYDYTELGAKGLPAARTYAAIAPSAPHALHMPSHIYARLGLWPEMVASNKAAAKAAQSELGERSLNLGAYNALHAWDYLMYAYLQLAQDNAAADLLRQLRQLRAVDVENFPAAYALAAIPARYVLENEDWKAAMTLTLFPPGLAWYKFPQAEAVTMYARALGAAHSGNVVMAKKDAQRLAILRDEMKEARNFYWAGQTEIQLQAVNAWIAYAEQRPEEAVKLLQAAAEAEAASDKNPVMPGSLLPTREQLGDLYLLLRQPAEALAAYEQSLKRDPNRFHGLYGAARTAEQLKNHAAAQSYYLQLVKLTETRDRGRPEISYAQRYVRGEEGASP